MKNKRKKLLYDINIEHPNKFKNIETQRNCMMI